MTPYFDYKVVTKPDQLPRDPHYAVLVYDTIYIPGDERSITSPGHGFPATNEPIVRFLSFTTEQALTEWIDTNDSAAFGRKAYSVLRVQPMNVSKSVTITLE